MAFPLPHTGTAPRRGSGSGRELGGSWSRRSVAARRGSAHPSGFRRPGPHVTNTAGRRGTRADVPRLPVRKVEEPEVGPSGKAPGIFTSLLAPGGQPQGRARTHLNARGARSRHACALCTRVCRRASTHTDTCVRTHTRGHTGAHRQKRTPVSVQTRVPVRARVRADRHVHTRTPARTRPCASVHARRLLRIAARGAQPPPPQGFPAMS